MRFLGGGSSYYSAEPVGHSGKCFLIPNTDIITVYKTFLAVSCRVSRPGILVLVRIFGPRKTPHAAATNSESLVSGRTINGVYGAAKREESSVCGLHTTRACSPASLLCLLRRPCPFPSRSESISLALSDINIQAIQSASHYNS